MTIIEITPEQLVEKIQNAVKFELSHMQQHKPDNLLTRKQAAELLDITLPTLTAWEKTGKIKSTRISSRVYFKESDLLKN